MLNLSLGAFSLSGKFVFGSADNLHLSAFGGLETVVVLCKNRALHNITVNTWRKDPEDPHLREERWTN